MAEGPQTPKDVLSLAKDADAKKPVHNHQKKRKTKCKTTTCPECVCPPPSAPPPPAPFCQGKNTCTQGDQPCQQEGTAACFCYVRADNAEPFCGRLVAGQPPVGSCTQCAAGQECMVLGGECPTGYACVTACPAPR